MTFALELGVMFIFLSMISSCGQGREGFIEPSLSLYIAYIFIYVICLQVTQFYAVSLECFILLLYRPL